MVSYGPDVQGLNFTHMVSFVDYPNKTSQIPPCSTPGTVWDFISKNPGCTIFKKLVESCRMTGQLDSLQANMTVFVPLDRFIDKKNTYDKTDNGLARQIFQCSSIDRQLDKNLLTSSPVAYYYTRLPQMRMYITNINGKTRINNCVSVVTWDIKLSNGIVHFIDGVLEPSDDHFMN